MVRATVEAIRDADWPDPLGIGYASELVRSVAERMLLECADEFVRPNVTACAHLVLRTILALWRDAALANR